MSSDFIYANNYIAANNKGRENILTELQAQYVKNAAYYKKNKISSRQYVESAKPSITKEELAKPKYFEN